MLRLAHDAVHRVPDLVGGDERFQVCLGHVFVALDDLGLDPLLERRVKLLLNAALERIELLQRCFGKL